MSAQVGCPALEPRPGRTRAVPLTYAMTADGHGGRTISKVALRLEWWRYHRRPISPTDTTTIIARARS